MTSPLDIAKETLEQRKQFAESLRILLEESKNINMDKLLVTKVENLKYSSYVGAVSFKQFASVGRFAHTLDWFTDKIIKNDYGEEVKIEKTIKNKLGEAIRVKRDDNEVQNEDLITQRPIKYPRQVSMVDYLLRFEENDAKFPPITAVVTTSASMNRENTKFYNADGKAIKSSVSFTPIDAKGDIGFLDLSDEFVVYALDGQHRLLAFNGLNELWNSPDKKLKAKNTDGVPINNEDKLISYEDYGFKSDSTLLDILNQKIVVEFIPAVYKGETFDLSIKRVRSHFIDYNDKSEKLKKQDISAIDDRDPFNVFAKYANKASNFLSKKEVFSSIKAQPTKGSSFLITLVNLKKLVSIVLVDKINNSNTNWYGKQATKVAAEKDKYMPLFLGLIDALSNLNDIKSYLETPKVDGTKAINFRSLSYHSNRKEWTGTIQKDDGSIVENNKGHILFTTVGMEALAYAYKNLVVGTLDDKENPGKLTKEEFAKRLKKFETSGANFNFENDKNSEVSVGLRHISLPQSIFYGVLLNPSTNMMVVKDPNTKLAGDLLTYILGDGDFDNKEVLQQELTLKRTVRDFYFDWDGKTVKIEQDGENIRNPIKLPPRI